MTTRQEVATLHVATELYDFVQHEVLPRTSVDPERFWRGLADAFSELSPTNDELLAERDRLQGRIDQWLSEIPTAPLPLESAAFLTSIGYLTPDPGPFQIETTGVDPEIAEIAGPQLVVPVLNARFVLNAVNARWGSLYDALYGTDALGSLPAGSAYDEARGAEVVRHVRKLLDEILPLEGASHADATAYAVRDGELRAATADGDVGLVEPTGLRGYRGAPEAPTSVLLANHGLHLDVVVDRDGRVGSTDAAGVDDVVIESAVTTIVDFEDSVAAVDAQDKVAAYRNWLGLNTGELEETITKGDRSFVRSLASDRTYSDPQGRELVLPGRALMLVRNVGHHMRTDAVIDAAGRDVYEGILDAFITVLAALPGLEQGTRGTNSRTGSVYVVKPKMHGPEEAAFTGRVFEHVERTLGLPPATVKIGVMDEERRTSVNLAACVRAVRDRIVFVNTGFLDRSGDEIHTAMEAGPVVRKDQMKAQVWLRVYEDRNVDVALATGFPGRAQIGKGMWAMPDLMGAMLEEKVAHPVAGATTAWVPSPTAATLHALHYHRVDVAARHHEIADRPFRDRTDLLWLPLADPATLSDEDRAAELESNAQSILGYVVRWVDQGIGCSKVPDVHDVGLMEDRATLRISSQLMANWLRHGLITTGQVRAAMVKMAAVVDAQNATDPAYRPMSDDPDSNPAFQASLELVLRGADQPGGYCEPILHRWRRQVKASSVAAR